MIISQLKSKYSLKCWNNSNEKSSLSLSLSSCESELKYSTYEQPNKSNRKKRKNDFCKIFAFFLSSLHFFPSSISLSPFSLPSSPSLFPSPFPLLHYSKLNVIFFQKKKLKTTARNMTPTKIRLLLHCRFFMFLHFFSHFIDFIFLKKKC